MAKKMPWSKFFWSDWRAEPGLRLCSLAARGLWIDMLALIAESPVPGHLVVAGRSPSVDEIARLVGAPAGDVQRCLAELESGAVFSRTGDGVIYCRRMAKSPSDGLSEKRQEAGRKGASSRWESRRNSMANGMANGMAKDVLPSVCHTTQPTDNTTEQYGKMAKPMAQKLEARGQRLDARRKKKEFSEPKGSAQNGRKSKQPPLPVPGSNVVPIQRSAPDAIPAGTELHAVAIKDIIFGRALRFVVSRVPNRPENMLRAWLGKLVRDNGELITLEALRRAQQALPVETISFVEGCCKRLKSTGGVSGGFDQADPLSIAGIN